MADYQESHILRMRRDLGDRFARLDEFLRTRPKKVVRGTDCVTIDAYQAQLLVDDFKAILAQIRKLK